MAANGNSRRRAPRDRRIQRLSTCRLRRTSAACDVGTASAIRCAKSLWRAQKEKLRTRRVRERDRAPPGQGAPAETLSEAKLSRAKLWRRERDSNPRYRCRYTRFPGVRLRPLGHLSGATGIYAQGLTAQEPSGAYAQTFRRIGPNARQGRASPPPKGPRRGGPERDRTAWNSSAKIVSAADSSASTFSASTLSAMALSATALPASAAPAPTGS